MVKKKKEVKPEPEVIDLEKQLGRRFWVLTILTAVGLALTGVSVVDGNRVTTWVMALITIMFAAALIKEAVN